MDRQETTVGLVGLVAEAMLEVLADDEQFNSYNLKYDSTVM
jgi:hypothetical protein